MANWAIPALLWVICLAVLGRMTGARRFLAVALVKMGWKGISADKLGTSTNGGAVRSPCPPWEGLDSTSVPLADSCTEHSTWIPSSTLVLYTHREFFRRATESKTMRREMRPYTD